MTDGSQWKEIFGKSNSYYYWLYLCQKPPDMREVLTNLRCQVLTGAAVTVFIVLSPAAVLQETSQTIVTLVRKWSSKELTNNLWNVGTVEHLFGFHEVGKVSPHCHQLCLGVVVLWKLKMPWSQRSNLTTRAWFVNVFRNMTSWAHAESCRYDLCYNIKHRMWLTWKEIAEKELLRL